MFATGAILLARLSQICAQVRQLLLMAKIGAAWGGAQAVPAVLASRIPRPLLHRPEPALTQRSAHHG